MAKRHHRTRPAPSAQRPSPALLAALAQIPAPLRPAVSRAFRTRPPCLLCDAPFYAVGAYVPPDPQAWGLEAGWHYGYVFGLCRGCVALPDRPARVEAILSQERARAVARWN